jgi:hypothetical protein
MDSAQVRQAISEHVVLALGVARNAAGKMRPGGTLLLMGGTGGRRVGHGLGIASADIAALAVHVMTNTALTGATYDIDGGQLPARLQLAGFLPDHVRALLGWLGSASQLRHQPSATTVTS